MKNLMFILISPLIIVLGCTNSSQNVTSRNERSNVDIAEEFTTVFYSFDSEKLKKTLSMALESQPAILYYQKWAECGNYEIINHHQCIVVNDSIIKCPVTVKDDLIGALALDFNVTDTFHLKIINGNIRSVNTSSNDPDLYYQAKEWVKINRPELISTPCEGILEDGPTPCECVRAMIQGFKEFIAEKNSLQK